MSATSTERITFDEFLVFSELSFEWATSYDGKDWSRLRGLLMPSLDVDLTSSLGPGHQWPSLPADEFIAMMSSPMQLGSSHMVTQHLLGGAKWRRVNDNEVVGTHQLRVIRVLYAAGDEGESGNFDRRQREVLARGTDHCVMDHIYKKNEEGVWKLAGITPKIVFDEWITAEIFEHAPLEGPYETI